MSTRYLFVDELAFISNRLRQVLHRHANQAAAQISFRDVQQVQKQIRTWDRDFVKPPMPLVAACNLEMLRDFYQQKLDFSIFQGFNLAEMEVIQEEIAAHAAREALDALIGYRLRNLAAIGLPSPKWQLYQELVRAYYERTVSQEKRERITALESVLAQTPVEVRAKCVGELFFEVDEIRLMSVRRLAGHLEGIREQAAGQRSKQTRRHQPLNVPAELRDSFQIFGLTDPVDFDALRARYRQLALSYHPDKGGSLEMMQQLNTAYRRISDYLRQVEMGEVSELSG
ncbi:MAG: J domain-containing protein [Candidatus Poribacteria bacterium]|nr:J domain-containing protein [Candidatus Poribacteria bacterium]